MNDRRKFIGMAVVGGGLALAASKSKAPSKGPPKPTAAPVHPSEDLMREHGILGRMMLIYEEGLRRLENGISISAEVFASTLRLQQRFLNDYHQKLEEDHVFPRIEAAGGLREMTQVLRDQHAAERRLTAQLLKNATPSGLGSSERRTALVEGLRSMNRMLRPHTLWEDTVLFPAFHRLFSDQEFEKLGQTFDDFERRALGPSGFEGVLAEVGQLEKNLGIDKLSGFTVHT